MMYEVALVCLFSSLIATCLCLHSNETMWEVGKRKLSQVCDENAVKNIGYRRYFSGMDNIYKSGYIDGTCYPVHKQCGWPSSKYSSGHNLPLYVLSVGLEGAGHHLWTKLLEQPVFDCVWTNARHYSREIGDGVPRLTTEKLKEGFKEQLKLRLDGGKPTCKSIFDSEDSFPTGAIRKSGRVFMRPDIINLHELDGVMFNVKYLIIIRNTTDTALSALRRNFFSDIDTELRTVEHTLTYIEAAMRAVPCNKVFIAHYEHVLADPIAFYEPIASFLELGEYNKKALKERLEHSGKLPSRKEHKMTQYKECQNLLDEKQCYDKVSRIIDDFFTKRAFMWPTFSGNGFLYG